MGRIMSDTEIKRRKRLQGHISQTTGTLGLASLGAFGASKIPAAKVLTKTPRLRRIGASPIVNAINPEKAKNASIGLSAASGGIGGAGAYNFAAYTNAESRKRKQVVPVKKDASMEMGYYGEEGRPLTHEQIEAEIEKAWTPSASNFDSEKSRTRRAKGYEGASLVGAGAGGAYAAHHGMQAVHEGGKLKPKVMSEVKTKINSAGKPYKIALGSQGEKAVPLKALKATGHHAGRAGVGLAAVAGAAATHSALKRKRSGSWQPYAKRDTTSAFGVDHSDNPNGQHRETEN
jgi:hypothetical protein